MTAQRADGTAWSFLLLERRLGLALVKPLEQYNDEYEAEAQARGWYHDAHAWLGLGLGFGPGSGWEGLGGPKTSEVV